MDVDRTAFTAILPSMLKHISKAHFIAFDLELSGIPTQRQRITDGKQTVAERYAELKHAAETYHILQIGLTCVEEDEVNKKYVMRAFNFNLSPLIYEGLDFERSFTYSSGAVDFLIQHNYQMNAPFASGIPYLTRPEAEEARERTRLRWDRDAIPDINVRPDNVEAVNFMKRARSEIDAWKKLPKSAKASVLGIYGQAPPGTADSDIIFPLDRFQKRLVHQIVRSDFPDLLSFGRSSCVEIQKKSIRDAEDEKYARESLQRRLNRAIFTQVGFRWVAEALAGKHGDLSGIDPGMCSRDITGEEPAETHEMFLKRLKGLRESLQQRKSILVGHNCFLDLIYIYKNFYGPLPDTVEEFQEAIHTLFPIIVDTKYMATSGSGAYTFRSAQLWQIQEAVSNEKNPVIESAEEHPQYQEAESYHQAGFDSFITAKVFLKLAARLESEASNQTTAKNGESGGKTDAPPIMKLDLKENIASSADIEVASSSSTQSAPTEKGKKSKKGKNKTKDSSAKDTSKDKFFSSNIYEQLLNLPDDPTPSIAEKPTSSSSALNPATANLPTEIAALKLNAPDTLAQSERNDKNMIPQWNSEFWRTYGNKLRIYGTEEEVCDLTQRRRVRRADSEDENHGGGVAIAPSLLDEPDGQRGSFWEVVKGYMP